MWSELCYAIINEMPFRPRFAVKFKDQPEAPVHHAEDIYWGVTWWDELGRTGRPFSDIEYLLVRSYKIKALHKYAKPELLDGEKQLEQILIRLAFSYECSNGVFRISVPLQ